MALSTQASLASEVTHDMKPRIQRTMHSRTGSACFVDSGCSAHATAQVQRVLGAYEAEVAHQERDRASPPGLVARTQAGAVVAMKVFMEQHEVAPARVVLKLVHPTVDRSAIVRITQ